MITKTLYRLFFISSLQITFTHADETMPSIELLEYLAEMEISTESENKSDWIDLFAMKDIGNTRTTDNTQEKGNE